VLFSEPKIPQSWADKRLWFVQAVSVLFSEPKIPQSFSMPTFALRFESFSALQRAENSSIEAEVKKAKADASFSALQRAENSSIPTLRCDST